MESPFFATVSRMKYIERWALMRSSRQENLSEHTAEVAMIAHALCLIGNRRYGKHLNADRAAVIALYHDASEIITGDMPTPVKYFNRDIKSAYKAVEKTAEAKLLSQLPPDLKPYYADLFGVAQSPSEDEAYLRGLVKAADKISALIKCIVEKFAGHTEFAKAEETTWDSVREICEKYPEASDFVRDFLPSYGRTLDELLS